MNLEDPIGGIFNAATLLESNNLLCFAFEIVKTVAPNSLATLFAVVTKPLQLLTDALDLPLLNLRCPALYDIVVDGKDFEMDLQTTFPGVEKSGGAL